MSTPGRTPSDKGISMKPLKNVFISSIYQNAGKTTVALGLYKLLVERRMKTAFLKPVGQQTVPIGRYNIDKDSYLIGEVFRCRRKLKDMSPVTIGPGYTEKYIFNSQKDVLRDKIADSFKKLTRGEDAIIIEGTGHAGVGSVVDLSNADVAKMLNSKVIIVSEGGIGRSIDEIMLNKALFDLSGVEVLGVIVNKVLPEKYDRVSKALKQGLKNKGLDLLGVIPLDPILRDPTVERLMTRLNLKLLSGSRENLTKRIRNTIIAAMEPENMVSYIKDGTMILTSGDRVDNIMVAVSSHLIMQGKKNQVSGLILSGGLVPDEKIMELLRKSHIPVLMSTDDTYTIAGKIEKFICKIETTDKDKISEAYQIVKKYVDVNTILGKL